MESLKQSINNGITEQGGLYTSGDVKDSITCLKNDKHDDVYELMSDHFIHAPTSLHEHISSF